MTGIQRIQSAVPRPTTAATPAEAKFDNRLAAPVDGFESAPAAKPVVSAPSFSFKDLLQEGVHLLEDLFGTHHAELDDFVKSTQDFRDTLATLRNTPSTDPRYAAAAQHLQDAYGYTPDTAPKPGTLWTSPRLAGTHLPDGQVTAASYPTGKGVTTPPSAMDAVFRSEGKPATILKADGTPVTVSTPEEYEALVAQRRADAGIRNLDGSLPNGKPVAVHLTLEGGGGLGKRYGPAINEMYEMGIVPASVSGTSVGAIAAGYLAAGADPATAEALASDPNVAKFMDFGLGGSGLMQGKYMYQYVDQKLRELTGIKDREVTFADLKIPLELPATILSDSNPPPGEDLSTPQGRLFVFSQETTPNTPVVDAMLASGAFPGVLPTVDIADPVTGRKLVLTDSGVIDGIPMRMHAQDGLPEVGISLQEPHSNHPDDPTNNEIAKPLPSGNLDTSNPVSVGLESLHMMQDNATETKDFHDRTDPKPGQFMLAIPIFDLNDARRTDKSLVFQAKPELDPVLDVQSRQVSHAFFSKILNQIGDPTAKATNLTTQVPKDLAFQRALEMDGHGYQASYSGGDYVHFDRDDGKSFDVHVGQRDVEAMYLDELAYPGSLGGELKVTLDDYYHPLHALERSIPVVSSTDWLLS